MYSISEKQAFVLRTRWWFMCPEITANTSRYCFCVFPDFLCGPGINQTVFRNWNVITPYDKPGTIHIYQLANDLQWLFIKLEPDDLSRHFSCFVFANKHYLDPGLCVDLAFSILVVLRLVPNPIVLISRNSKTSRFACACVHRALA